MVTRDEIVESLTGKYSDLELVYNSGGYEMVRNGFVGIALSPESSIQSFLMNMKRTVTGRIRDNFKVEEVYVKGSTDLDDYNDLFQFSKFIDEKLEERNLDRTNYYGSSKITKTLNIGEEFNETELLNTVGSVIKAEISFAEIYEANKNQALLNYNKRWRD